jgi:small-conductance mechanosensitive channel
MEASAVSFSIRLIPEIIAVVLSGLFAWGLDRWIGGGGSVGKVWPHTPVQLGDVVRRAGTAVRFPLIWTALLLGTDAGFRALGLPTGLLEIFLPVVGLFILFRGLLAGAEPLLARRPFTGWMLHLAVTLGLILLFLRLLGLYAETMDVVDHPFLALGPASISISVILKSAFLIWLIFVAASLITDFFQNRVLTRTRIDPNLSFAMMRFTKFFLFGIAVLIVLDTAGVNLSALTIFGGALGIGLGFGLQNIANNLVSGWILLIDRSIKQGDVITVGDSYGWVVRLGARYIVVRTRDGVEKLIPNANLITSEITNWSHSDRAVRLHVKVGVSYDADPHKVRDLLLHVAGTHPRVLKKPQPNVLFVDFGDSSLEFEMRIWINDPEEGIESVRSAIRFEIWKAFKENGIQIPYPQRDIHIKGPSEPAPTPEFPSEGYGEPLPVAKKPRS